MPTATAAYGRQKAAAVVQTAATASRQAEGEKKLMLVTAGFFVRLVGLCGLQVDGLTVAGPFNLAPTLTNFF